MNWAAITWLVLMVLFIWIEASTVTMASLWFAAGALVSMIIALLGGQLWLQAVVFLVVSGVLLWLLRPVAKKYFTPKLTKTNVEAIIGTRGIVTEEIDNLLAQGQVRINGLEWTARSTSGEKIPAGSTIKVDRIEGVKVFVTPVEVKANV
jgi:membrane protein implicated in regulation of membrane protease activity